MKVLVLGHKGMLGHMVLKYLADNLLTDIYVIENQKFPSKEFKNSITSGGWDYIINCIGAIPQRTDNFDINHELPLWLEKNTQSKIIHPGTDCEMDDDAYGISKKMARDFIIEEGTHTKILKTSIIGPELGPPASLMDWFLSQEGEVGGYTEAMWNGNTTLQWAKECLSLILNWGKYETETILEGTCVSKFELLGYIKEVFNKDIKINPNDKVRIDKCLTGNKKMPHIKDQLIDLKKYYFLEF